MPTTIYPPGPFPPHGEESPDSVDLGIRIRDLLYTRQMITAAARRVLAANVRAASNDRNRLMATLPAVEMLIDTWPLGAMVDEARETWKRGPDGRSLAILYRAAEIAAAAMGWPRTVDRRWPMPDEEWIRETAGIDDVLVMGRGDRDGSPAVAVALDTRFAGFEPVHLPTVIEAQGDRLQDDVDQLIEAIEAGEGVAVRFVTPVPWDEASQAALGRIRAAAPSQVALERYGDAGLLVEQAPSWREVLKKAPPGMRGNVVKRLSDALVLPAVDEQGALTAVGVLAWDGPYAPVQVMTGAVQILGVLDGVKDIATVASEVDAQESVVRRVIEQLVDLGAATA